MSGRDDIAERLRRHRATGSGMQREDLPGAWDWRGVAQWTLGLVLATCGYWLVAEWALSCAP